MIKLYLLVRTFFTRHLTPTRIFVSSFAGCIMLGTLFLWMPFSAGNAPLRFVDALFVSASAVCVTGLSPIDIGKDLSFAGQIITMILFQVGGLGIITFSLVLFALMGKGIPIKGREIAQTAFLHTPRRDFFLIVRKVLLYTFIIEAVGALFLLYRFSGEYPFLQAIYYAVYHAISAFNNCGFSLFPDSFVRYQSDAVVTLTMSALIVLGGIGFIVQQEVVGLLKGAQKKLSLHTRIVLIATAVLITAGFIFFYFMENNNALRDASSQTAVLSSLFLSITARTAGFNTVDIGTLTNSTILVLMVLMFIGASPGSAGGGVKTTSFALLFLLIVNRLKGNEKVNVANRTMPPEIIEKTISIIFASAFCICLIASVLLLFGSSGIAPLASRYQFAEYLFETISAFGTVGLSMNLTPQLNDVQKYAIILIMFVGRVGPLTMAYALYSARKKGITYAEESIMVG